MIKHFGFHTNKETNLKVIGFRIYNLIQIMIQVNITDYPKNSSQRRYSMHLGKTMKVRQRVKTILLYKLVTLENILQLQQFFEKLAKCIWGLKQKHKITPTMR